MTYKDHGEIALIFRKHLDKASKATTPEEWDNPYNVLTDLMEDIADYCYRDNLRFDRDKFYIAAGIGIV